MLRNSNILSYNHLSKFLAASKKELSELRFENDADILIKSHNTPKNVKGEYHSKLGDPG